VIYGEQTATIANPAATTETKGFVGERYDADAGLQYLNARYYDPQLALFIQPDWFEVTMPGVGTNRFAYAGDDPINASDPGGNQEAEGGDPTRAGVVDNPAQDQLDATLGALLNENNSLHDQLGQDRETRVSNAAGGDASADIIRHYEEENAKLRNELLRRHLAHKYATDRLDPSRTLAARPAFLDADGQMRNMDVLPRSRSLSVQYGSDGYPVNKGTISGEVGYEIPAGTQQQRIGSLKGSYVSFSGANASSLSLPPENGGGITTYKTERPTPSMAGQVAPAYGQPGGGYQMRLGSDSSPMSVYDAVNAGFLTQLEE
jgi:RHS repeat-associated protein